MNKVLIYLLATILLVSGCMRPDRKDQRVPASQKFLGIINTDQFKPRAYRNQTFDHTPGGDESYDIGFKDGCQTATSAIGEGLYRLRGPKIDAEKLSHDQWYLRGFQDASTYCTFNLDWETH